MIDATQGVTEQDTKIAGEAHEAGKGVIIAINKWDEYDKQNGTLEKYTKDVYFKLPYLSYAQILVLSTISPDFVKFLHIVHRILPFP